MTTLADRVAAYTRTATARCYLNGQRWYAVQTLSTHQKFKENVSTGQIQGRDPPIPPQIGMDVRWTWGWNGLEVAGFTGEIAGFTDMSYPDRWSLQCNDVLWRADKSSQVLQTDPLNDILARVAVTYLLTHYAGIPASRISIPPLLASGAAWAGPEWTLGTLTPVQWGDIDTQSGGTTALRAAAEICSCLGFWLYADAGGKITAKQMERKPSQVAREVFRREVNLLRRGSPERQQSYENVFNQATVRGANTGVDGAQLYDQFRTASSLLPANVYRDFPFSSILLEYENASDAGPASITEVAKRILNVVSRIPDVVPLRAKADPNRKVGDTVGIVDTGILLSTQKNFFIYQIDRTLDLQSGAFDDALLLDGGTGNTGFTTVPPPDASFSWTLMRETLDSVDVTEVALDGSASTSPTGEIVSWDWSTSTPTYGGTPNTASGVHATFVFETADSPAAIELVVTDTTSKTDTFDANVDLTGADSRPPIHEALHGAAGSAWYATPDGGSTWRTAGGDAISVDIIGAGADDRAPGTAGTYGIVTTRGSGGASGLRGSLDLLTTTPTSLVANPGAVTSNIWRNEASPARLWWAVGTAVYRSTDNGVTKVAMHAAPDTVTWIMEDAAAENSVFLLSGADMLNATDPTIGYAILYPGPLGATARQFVRSRDGEVTWICYVGAPAGEALQRVENGVRSLALDRQATSLAATVYAVSGDDPAQLWSFDGLTGLDAVQSTQTFPSGATVQHMLASRQFDVIYTADFDSVASGQGAFRKWFPLSDQLLLWRELASGEQGHMLGLAARASAPAEFLRMTAAVDPAGVWHYQSTRAGDPWAFRQLGPTGTVHGVAIAADPFNVDRWISVWNNADLQCFDNGGVVHGNGWAYSPVWVTEDAGVTWTEVEIATPAGWVDGSILVNVSYNDLIGNSWCAAFASGGTFYTAAVFGSGSTVTHVSETTSYSAPVLTGGADGDWLLAVTFSAADGLRYFDTAFHTPAGASPADFSPAGTDRFPGVSRVAFVADGGFIYSTNDYRAAQPTSLIATTNALALSVSATTLYYIESGGDVWRVVDPLGAATATKIVNTFAVVYPHVDRQTRTIGATASNGAIIVDDGVTTTTIAGPPGLLSSSSSGGSYAFEVMVRP
jgi:hypothetical protein